MDGVSRRQFLRSVSMGFLLMGTELSLATPETKRSGLSYEGPFAIPPLSRVAFQSRMDRIRKEMTRSGIDCLLVSSVINHAVRYVGFYDAELQGRGSGAPQLVSVLLPVSKDPVLFLQSFTAADYMLPRAKAGTYIEDLRLVGGGNERVIRDVAAQITNWKMSSATLGLVGNEIDWAEKLLFRDLLPKLRIVDANSLLNSLRIVKEPEEIELLRRSAEIGDAAMNEVERRIGSGVTDFDLYSTGDSAIRRAGGEEDSFVLMGFGPNVNPMIMEPLNGRRIRRGDVIVYETLPFYRLYNTELAVTFSVGKPTEVQAKAAEACQAAYEAGLERVKPGVDTDEIVAAALKAFRSYGFESFTHTAGHFIGLDNYEGPPLHSTGTVLQAGMVFSFHPNVVVPNKAKEEICGLLLVTNQGVENLSHFKPTGIRVV